MPAHPSAAAEAAWHALLTAHRSILPRLDADLRRDHELPLDWYDILVQLAMAGGTMTMGQLADSLMIGASRCSRRVDRLGEAGLVTRRRDQLDSRVVHAVLTEQGGELQQRAAATHARSIQAHFGRFVDDNLAGPMTRALLAAVADLPRPADC